MIVDSALAAVAAGIELLHDRNQEFNTPQMVVAELAKMQQADWDKIAADIASGNLAAERTDVS